MYEKRVILDLDDNVKVFVWIGTTTAATQRENTATAMRVLKNAVAKAEGA